MGVKTIDDKSYISFSVPADYEKTIGDGMAWGVTTVSDNKFHPILYVKNFTMPPKNSGGCMGELVMDGCDLVLSAENAGIVAGNLKIHSDAMPGVFFTDISKQKMLLGIIPENGVDYDSIYILDNIKFYKNQYGSNSFRIGLGDNSRCLFTDEGQILCNYIDCNGQIFCDDDISCYGSMTCTNFLTVSKGITCTNGYVSGIAFQNTSLAETKKNIEKYNKSAIEEIKNTDIYIFNYKQEKDGRKSLGAIIGDNYNCSNDIISNDEKSINLYSMVSLSYKALQEQQEEIEELRKENKQKNEIIQNLIERIEAIEKGGTHE